MALGDERRNLMAQESERQRAVDASGLSGFDRTAFDDIARAAADLLGTPVGLVTVIDREHQRFVGRAGTDLEGTPRAISFCDQAIQTPDAVMVVEDATLDPRYAANPLVTGELHIRFYAGAPLVSDEGRALGTLCVLDVEPRRVDPAKLEELRFLAAQVMRAVNERNRAAG
jgi:GAF domain-containing protein